MNKKIKTIIISICILWITIFTTDFIRCSSLLEPIFVVPVEITTDDGGSGIYQGLGYTVKVEKYVDAEYGSVLSAVEMRVFGRVIAASIS